jgi:hypothetical protein
MNKMILREIPGTLGFVASDCGKIFDPSGNERTVYQNGDGYLGASVLVDVGVWVTFGIQRLVALTHVHCDGDPATLTVNHIDHDVTNNSANNLEWVTTKLNNVHAALMRNDGGRPTILAKMPDGKYTFIGNLIEASELLNRSIKDLWEAIKTCSVIDGWTLSHHGTRDPIPEELRKVTILTRDASGRPPERSVKMKDVLGNGEISLFATMNAAARHFDTSPSHIYQTMYKDSRLKLFRKKYLVVYGDEQFPNLNTEELEEAIGRGPKDVIAYNLDRKQFFIFESAMSFITMASLSKKAVTVRLKKNAETNTLSEVSGWLFAYMVEGMAKKFEERIGSPVP